MKNKPAYESKIALESQRKINTVISNSNSASRILGEIKREVFSINEAAYYVGGVNPVTIRKLVREKQLASFRVAKRIFIRKAVIDAWIQAQENGE